MDGITTSILAGSYIKTSQSGSVDSKERKKPSDEIRKVNRRPENSL